MWQMYVEDFPPPVKNIMKDSSSWCDRVRWRQWAQRISSFAFAVLTSEVQGNNFIREWSSVRLLLKIFASGKAHLCDCTMDLTRGRAGANSAC